MNSKKYTKILKDHVIDFFHMHEQFQRDNATAHTSIKTKKRFWQMDPNYRKFVEFPEEKHL